MSKSSSHDVIISGGGIPGLTLALLLANANFEVVLIDPAPLSHFKLKPAEGRTSALMQSSIAVLKESNIWDIASPHGEPLKILRIIDDSLNDRNRMIETDFCASDIGLDYFGINFPNNVLRTLLAHKVTKQRNIKLYDGCTLDSFEQGPSSVQATLSSGPIIKASLLVAADGRESLIRKICGIKAHIHAYGQTAITCLIDHSKSHGNISTEFHRSGGPFTLVPMPDKSSSVVWVEKDADAARLMHLSKADFEKTLQEKTREKLGRISLTTAPQSCPLIGLRSAALTAPRVALMAESAHVLSPLGAQGLNLSLRDVKELATKILEARQLGLDIGSKAVLQSYENARRSDIMIRYAGTDGLTRFVSHNIIPLHNVRRAGLGMISMIEPLRQIAMKQGMAV